MCVTLFDLIQDKKGSESFRPKMNRTDENFFFASIRKSVDFSHHVDFLHRVHYYKEKTQPGSEREKRSCCPFLYCQGISLLTSLASSSSTDHHHRLFSARPALSNSSFTKEMEWQWLDSAHTGKY